MQTWKSNLTFGIWAARAGIFLAVAYLAALIGAAVSPAGFPPVEPYDVAISGISLLSGSAILILFVVLHETAPVDRKLFSRIAMLFAVLFCAMTSINRFVHLAVIRPSVAMGKTDGLEWFTPYGVNSVIGSLEILAWSFFLGLAFLFAAFVFRGVDAGLFWVSLVNSILCLVSTLTPLTGVVFFTFLGVPAWGPGFILFCVLLIRLFRRGLAQPSVAG